MSDQWTVYTKGGGKFQIRANRVDATDPYAVLFYDGGELSLIVSGQEFEVAVREKGE